MKFENKKRNSVMPKLLVLDGKSSQEYPVNA